VENRLRAKSGNDVSIIDESFTNINAEATLMCKIHNQFSAKNSDGMPWLTLH
jgi:tetrahydrodipicolinate N-succinyltransferase